MFPKARIHHFDPPPPLAAVPAPAVEGADELDRLPDSLVLLILNKVADVRSLGRCTAVSRRLSSLVPLVHDAYLRVDRVVTVDGDADGAMNLSSPKPRVLLSHLLRLLLVALAKPFRAAALTGGANHRPLFPQLAHHSPAHVLRHFTHLRHLHIDLPSADVGTEDGILLKWRAEYGTTLESCVILGGTLVDRKPSPAPGAEHEPPSQDDNGSMPESFYTNGGLKLRVVWTISSLIAASTRHYLLRSIIKEHPSLTSLVLTDSDGQGMLCMSAQQLKEFRENEPLASACSNRTQVPACNMKLKYAPYIELPCGGALQGATLVVVRPSGATSSGGKEAEGFVSGVFGPSYKGVVKALMKRRTYLLEMNGF